MKDQDVISDPQRGKKSNVIPKSRLCSDAYSWLLPLRGLHSLPFMSQCFTTKIPNGDKIQRLQVSSTSTSAGWRRQSRGYWNGSPECQQEPWYGTCARLHGAVGILVHEDKSSSGEIRAVVRQVQEGGVVEGAVRHLEGGGASVRDACFTPRTNFFRIKKYFTTKVMSNRNDRNIKPLL